jgi:hypothetical protein
MFQKIKLWSHWPLFKQAWAVVYIQVEHKQYLLLPLLCYEAIRQDNNVPNCRQEITVIFHVKKIARLMSECFTVNFGNVRNFFSHTAPVSTTSIKIKWQWAAVD